MKESKLPTYYTREKFNKICVFIWASQVTLVVKNPPANAGDMGDMCLIPGLGRSPGGGHGNLLQCSCLENSMDRGAWRATVHGGCKESDRTEHTKKEGKGKKGKATHSSILAWRIPWTV